MITQEELKQKLHYNPETGVFTWLKSVGTVKSGTKAGGLTKIGYVRIYINKKAYLAHRLAFFYMEGYWPIEIDHKDLIKHNNAWDNLRQATRLDNVRNVGLRKDNTSGHKGVTWYSRYKQWIVVASVKGVQKTVDQSIPKNISCNSENKITALHQWFYFSRTIC